MAELIRVDVIEHKVSKGADGKIKRGGGDSKTKAKTPEEMREAENKKAAREKANAARARNKAIRSGVVYTSMAIRKMAQVGGQVAGMLIDYSYNRQVYDAKMSGDTRKAQLLQNKKTLANSQTTFVTTQVNNLASTAAGFAVNPYLGLIQVATYLMQFSLDIMNKNLQFQESLRQYRLNAERQVALSEYMRGRLLLNTFNNRGFF